MHKPAIHSTDLPARRTAPTLMLLAGSALCLFVLSCSSTRTQANRNSWPRYDRGGVPVVARAVSRDTGTSTRSEPVADRTPEPVIESVSWPAPAPIENPPTDIASTDEAVSKPEAPVVATTMVYEAPAQTSTSEPDFKPLIARPMEDLSRDLASWTPRHAPASRIVTLDGDTSEWSDGSVIRADEQYVYVRFSIEGSVYTLQSSETITSIMFDADFDATTGKHIAIDGTALGVDVEVQLSPSRRSAGGSGRGAQVLAHDARTGATVQSPYDWDFMFAPTYASEWYEARISRTPGVNGVVRSGMLSEGSVRGIVATLTSSGEIDASSEVFELRALPSARTTRSDLPLPEKPSGAVRVVSYNVLRTSPASKPQVFQRVLGALQPDIVLLQEWESTDASQIREWFDGLLPSAGGWHVRAITDTVQNMGGVAIVSRFPLRGEQVRVTHSDGRGVRANLAVADGPWGPMLLSSVHLKSGGSMGSREDQLRINEAGAVREALLRVGAEHAGAWRIVGGDVNLVGTRDPLDILASGSDNDSSSLLAVPTPIWGDAAMYTWSERGNAFTPGRLDWVLVGDSTCRVLQSFTLDTSRLSDAVLARSGLTAGDTAEASDHLPVVVDLAPVR